MIACAIEMHLVAIRMPAMVSPPLSEAGIISFRASRTRAKTTRSFPINSRARPAVGAS